MNQPYLDLIDEHWDNIDILKYHGGVSHQKKT